MSSFSATRRSVETELPMYTANKVSKLLSAVLMIVGPEMGAVHRHQADRWPAPPAWEGSKGSRVNPRLEAW